MKPETKIKIAYRNWCKLSFPDYKVQDFPCHGRMYQVWEAAWLASKEAT
jgi:hypothetical protein